MPGPATASADPDRLEHHARRFGTAPVEVRRALARAARLIDASPALARVAGVSAAGLQDRRRAVEALAARDRACAATAADFRTADGGAARSEGPCRVAEARLVAAAGDRVRGGRRVPLTVLRPAEGVRVVAVGLDPLVGASAGPLAWSDALERARLGAGPVHVVVHGWGADSHAAGRAGELTAELAATVGLDDATVLVVDWPAGEGTREPPWAVPGDFAAARRAARPAGEALAGLLVALAARGAQVSVAAHSLGAEVVVRALERVAPTVELDLDLLVLQAAVPVAGPDAASTLAALAGPQVARLTVTVDHRDASLGLYELVGPPALGDERADSGRLAALVAARAAAGRSTEVVAHHDPDGRGHLHLAPSPAHPRVRALTADLLARAAGRAG